MSGDLTVYGEPRFASGAQGRAVHLSRLVLWLMKQHECVRVEAVRMLLEKLASESGSVVYEASPGGNGTPLNMEREWYPSWNGSLAAVPVRGRRVLSRGIGQGGVSAPRVDSLGTGRAGFVAWLRGFWGRSENPDSLLASPDFRGCWLMVSEADAQVCWGWGSDSASEAVAPDGVASDSATVASVIEAQDVSDWPSLVRYRQQFADVSAQKRPAWMAEHVALLAARLHEEHRSGRAKGASERLAKELGYKRGERVRQLLEGSGYNATTGIKPASHFDGMSARRANSN
ncbi:MAG: hypothetical protein LBE30_05715 [Comamonas sp.]|jgi:hypothetical protein|nr:hypothetical protein [Comamonas sp.]